MDIIDMFGHYETVWKPLDGSQLLAFLLDCDHILYDGTRGPGKTTTQLMRFYRLVGKGYGAFWRGVIFDLEFDNLAGLVAESKKWFRRLGTGARFLESASNYKWVWPTGEELLFRHVKKESDYYGFHGQEYPFIGWNELTKHPTSALYDRFMSVNRCSFVPEINTPRDKYGRFNTPDGMPLPPIPLEVFSTSNPSGPGHNWVKKRFVNAGKPGELVSRNVEIFNPRTQANDTVTRTQCRIFGSYRENKYLPPEYIAELESIKDENLRRAWLYGDWDVTAGGAVDDLWRSHIHIVPRFVVPSSWRIDRSYDDGSSHPFSVGFWAETDGTEAEVVYGGKSYAFAPPRGSLVRYFEWYGCARDEHGDLIHNQGLKLSAATIAQKINDINAALVLQGWVDRAPEAGPADNRIRQVIDSAQDTTEKIMARHGITWLPSDKSPGSRIVGLQLIRDRLEASITGEGPGLYFMDNCKAAIELFPVLPRDERRIDDVDTKAEDHIYDEIRYRVLHGASKHVSKFKYLMPT